MRSWAHDLSYEECDAWRAAHGLEWEALLRRADVKSHKDLVKSRWHKGEAPRDRIKIRVTLEDAERRKSTSIGATILGLEEWLRIGETLASDPDVFLHELGRLREMATLVAEMVEAARRANDATAAMKAFRSATPEPKKARK